MFRLTNQLIIVLDTRVKEERGRFINIYYGAEAMGKRQADK